MNSTVSVMYLDYNATAPLRPCVKNALPRMLEDTGNPSSVHAHGRHIRRKIEDARRVIADVLRIAPRRITFTSGATEANNIILLQHTGAVFVSAIEHDSVFDVRPDAHIIPVTADGYVDTQALDDMLKAHQQTNPNIPALVAVMAANNETGVIQPLEDIASLCACYGAFLHVDAVQALGRIPLNLDHIYTMSLSAHKIGGLSGVGALIKGNAALRHAQKQGLRDAYLPPLMIGGGQERSLRPGTENILGIISFGLAIADLHHDDWQATRACRDHFEAIIQKNVPHVYIAGQKSERLPNTSMVCMPPLTCEGGVALSSEVQLMRFDHMNISISAGSACSSGKVKTSRVLKAMGVADDWAKQGVRISFSPGENLSTAHHIAQAWSMIYDETYATHKQKLG